MFSASPLSLAAIGLYLLVIASIISGAVTARQFRQQPWHLRGWLALALLFAMLIVARLFDLEEVLRDSLRDSLRQDHTYGERGDFQRPIAAGIIALGGAAMFWWFYRIARTIRGRRNVAVMLGLAGGLCMLLLVGLRLISLHPVDRLLYGPLKFNWLADLGLSCVVGWAAWRYSRIVRG